MRLKTTMKKLVIDDKILNWEEMMNHMISFSVPKKSNIFYKLYKQKLENSNS